MNAMLTVVAMEWKPFITITGALLFIFTKKKKNKKKNKKKKKKKKKEKKKMMFNEDVAFDSLQCYFHQSLYA